jgi:hypothetical protein
LPIVNGVVVTVRKTKREMVGAVMGIDEHVGEAGKSP